MDPTDRFVPSSAALRVLVIDDNEDVAEMTAEMIKMCGHEALTAGDGPSALSLAESERPDVVLLDLGLPGMHGIVAKSGGKTPLLIAVSGYGRPEDRERSRRAGCEHDLVKPVDFDRLLALLATQTPAPR